MNNVQFISYNGKYPNIEQGELTIRIDGKEYRFGHDYTRFNKKTKTFINEFYEPNFDEFWLLSKEKNEWILNTEKQYPKYISNFISKIFELFKQHVILKEDNR